MKICRLIYSEVIFISKLSKLWIYCMACN